MFGQNDTTIDGLVDWVEVRLVGEILLDLKGIMVVEAYLLQKERR